MRITHLLTAISAAMVMATAQATERDLGSAMEHAPAKQAAVDCSINWVSESGRIYCFGKEEVKKDFVKDVQAPTSQPQIFWSGRLGP